MYLKFLLILLFLIYLIILDNSLTNNRPKRGMPGSSNVFGVTPRSIQVWKNQTQNGAVRLISILYFLSFIFSIIIYFFIFRYKISQLIMKITQITQTQNQKIQIIRKILNIIENIIYSSPSFISHKFLHIFLHI